MFVSYISWLHRCQRCFAGDPAGSEFTSHKKVLGCSSQDFRSSPQQDWTRSDVYRIVSEIVPQSNSKR